jgi:ATP-dependent Clp protease ATP-binding subunit ClpA
MLSNEFESCLNQAFHQARNAHHEFLTIEHLLLAILDTATVREVLKGCGADLDQLGADLQQHIAANNLLWVPVPGEDHAVQPQLGLQRVLQRAVFHVKSSGKKEVGVLDVLVATFSEKQSGAVFLLTRARVTRVGVVNYMAGSTGHVLPADAGTKSNGTGSPAHGK